MITYIHTFWLSEFPIQPLKHKQSTLFPIWLAKCHPTRIQCVCTSLKYCPFKHYTRETTVCTSFQVDSYDTVERTYTTLEFDSCYTVWVITHTGQWPQHLHQDPTIDHIDQNNAPQSGALYAHRGNLDLFAVTYNKIIDWPQNWPQWHQNRHLACP